MKLGREVEQLHGMVQQLRKEVAQLQGELDQLRAENGRLRRENGRLAAENAAMGAAIEGGQGAQGTKPSFVKPKRAEREKKGRKQREEKHNQARKLEKPTRVERHRLEKCPDCGELLVGGLVHYQRQVIEIPAPQPYEYHHSRALAKRLLRHEHELFQFVLQPCVPADNYLAERALRPLVVQRKISGGSRSPQGSQTRMALASLFETWKARQLNPLVQCWRELGLLMEPALAVP